VVSHTSVFPYARRFPLPHFIRLCLQLPLSPLSPSPVTTFPSSSLSCSPLLGCGVCFAVTGSLAEVPGAHPLPSHPRPCERHGRCWGGGSLQTMWRGHHAGEGCLFPVAPSSEGTSRAHGMHVLPLFSFEQDSGGLPGLPRKFCLVFRSHSICFTRVLSIPWYKGMGELGKGWLKRGGRGASLLCPTHPCLWLLFACLWQVLRAHADAITVVVDVFLHDPLYQWVMSEDKKRARQEDGPAGPAGPAGKVCEQSPTRERDRLLRRRRRHAWRDGVCDPTPPLQFTCPRVCVCVGGAKVVVGSTAGCTCRWH
jgi:hypothetical protein